MASVNRLKEKWIPVQAYKHDGSLHRLWSAGYLVEETDEYWALATRSSLVIEDDGREWITKEHAIFYLFKNKWMNVIAMLKESGGICFYANIASPSIYDKGFIKYIDYDLDVKLYPDGKEKILDIEEFNKNAHHYGYSQELIRKIKDSEKEVEAMADRREFPFDGAHMKELFKKFEEENAPVKEYRKPKVE